MREGYRWRLWLLPAMVLGVVLFARQESLSVAVAEPLDASRQQQSRAIILRLGQEIYGSQCQACHGKQGHGDGPAARFLESQPRDLTADEWESVSERTEPAVASVIRGGIDGTEMEPFDDLLEEDEILAVAAYVIETFVRPLASNR